jgi:peptidoglycan hydrolase-like protein with peptidoglycan-binding domain
MPAGSPRSGSARVLAVLCGLLAAGAVVGAVAFATDGPAAPTTTVAGSPAPSGQDAAGRTWSELHRDMVARAAAIRARKAARRREAREKAAQARAEALKLEPGEKGPRVHKLQDRLVSFRMLREDQADGSYGDATQAAVMAFQKAAGIDRDGIDGPKTQRALEDGLAAPEPFSDGDGNRVEISISKQLAQIVKDGRVTRVISVSSGRPGFDTPTGRYAVYLKDPHAYSKKYDAPMPLASFFTGSYGLHESADVPGYPASHGCVRIPAAFAGEVYDFAGMGTPVVIVS